MKKVAVLLANGFEEGESFFVIDVLRRAGITCDGVSIQNKEVTGSHDITVKADKLITEVDRQAYDMIVLPGGQPGATNLTNCEDVISWLQDFDQQEDKYIAAICAAPMAVAKAGIVNGRKVTSYPNDAYRDLFKDDQYVDDVTEMEDMVVVDDRLITSRGPASTLPFAYKLVELLGGNAEDLKEKMLFNQLKEAIK